MLVGLRRSGSVAGVRVERGQFGHRGLLVRLQVVVAAPQRLGEGVARVALASLAEQGPLLPVDLGHGSFQPGALGLAFAMSRVVGPGQVRGEDRAPLLAEHPVGEEPGDRVEQGVFAEVDGLRVAFVLPGRHHVEFDNHDAQVADARRLASAPETVIFNLTRPNGAGTMWAPEFHLLDSPNGKRWYFYYTAGRQPFDLHSQRIHVLESAGTDPMGPYSFKADMLDPTHDDSLELDASILQLNGKLYLLGTFTNGSQPNFIRPLSNPWTASGTRRILSTPAHSWEKVGHPVNEGPEVLQRNGKTFIVFSASHCSTPDYKLGILTYNGGDPLQQSSWVKSSQPVFQRNDANGVFGPGHNGFFMSPDGTEDWIVYHANSSAGEGCSMKHPRPEDHLERRRHTELRNSGRPGYQARCPIRRTRLIAAGPVRRAAAGAPDRHRGHGNSIAGYQYATVTRLRTASFFSSSSTRATA
ncbi:family 43 glycosylhydrolase [Amycolatopsis lurida]